MLKIVIALMAGGLIGFTVAALCVAAKKGDEQGQDNKTEYRCEDTTCGCEGRCCWTCFIASECTKDSKCKSNPGECGKTKKFR